MSAHISDVYDDPCWGWKGYAKDQCKESMKAVASRKKEPIDMYPPHAPFRQAPRADWEARPYDLDVNVVRTFETGATRDLDTDKHDPEGFLSPLALEAFNTYMHFNRYTAAGMRDSDNWQKGIPLTAYMKSGFRHFIEWWKGHRKLVSQTTMLWALLALLFNVQGYIHELLKEDPDLLAKALEEAEGARVTPPLEEPVGFIPQRKSPEVESLRG